MLQKNRLLYFISIILIALVFIPIKLPISLSSKGQLLPYKTWTLAKETSGRLTTSLNDNSTGINSEYSVIQFERGDAVQFKINSELVSRNFVSKGDTIGYIISSEIEKDIEKLRGELETARASLKVQTSSEKESIIEAEKQKLTFAQKELDEQKKIYDRKKKLYDRDLISLQEFEADEARYELAKINIDIAQERLRTVQSGAKEEEINFAAAQINSIENQISVLQRRYESNNIVSPTGGLLKRLFSSDTLLIVNDTSKLVCLIPVKWSEISKIKIDQKVVMSSQDVDEEIEGRVIFIDNSISTFNSEQYVMVNVLSDARIEQMKTGLIVDCKFDLGNNTILSMIIEFLKPIFK